MQDHTIVFDRIMDVQHDKKMYFVVVKHISPSLLPVSLLFLYFVSCLIFVFSQCLKHEDSLAFFISKNFARHSDKTDTLDRNECLYCCSSSSPYATGASKFQAIRPCMLSLFLKKELLLRFFSGHCKHRQHLVCVLLDLYKKSREKQAGGARVSVSFRFACCRGTQQLPTNPAQWQLDPGVSSVFSFTLQ